MTQRVQHSQVSTLSANSGPGMGARTGIAIERDTGGESLIARLAAAFEREGVVYSHWKSNMGLRAAAGDGAMGQEQIAISASDYDLDLLVERASLSRALAVLSELGFKKAVVRWGRNTPGNGSAAPGISHYYGLDATSGELVHVHLFSHVLTGESFVKSHHLPLDEMLLQNSHPAGTGLADLGSLRLTSKPAELVLFTLRMFIKYSSLPDLLVLRSKSRSIQREVRWLLAGEPSGDGASPAVQSLALLNQHLPTFDTTLFQRCLEMLDSNASLFQRMQLARQVRRQLKPYAQHSYAGRIAAYAWLFAAETRRRLAPGPRRKNKRPYAGGAIIAFVGAEATGKSTLVADSGRWLGSAFGVQTVHAGKPPATLLTAPLNLLLPLLRTRLSSLRTSRLEGHVPADEAPTQVTLAAPDQPPNKGSNKGFASLVYALRAVTLAWERRQLLVRVARAAAKGDIVLCDRYPSDNIGTMDSPRLQPDSVQGRGAAGSAVSQLYNWLARLEQRLYRQIPPPDIALRLNVSLETAQQRNRDRIKPGKESDAYLISRHRQAREWRNAGTRYVHDIDTNQSLPDTIHAVRQAIWEGMP